VDLLTLVLPAIAVGLVGVMLLIGFTRKGSVATVPMTRRRKVLHSMVPPAVVYAWLTEHCPTGYSVDDGDPARGVIVLSSRPTMFDWGFFYPTIVYAEDVGTRIDVGIKSKVFQYGPLVKRAHRNLAQTLANLTQSRIEGS
jgi:hypothetical protein